MSFEKQQQQQLPFCPTVGRVGWRVNSSQKSQQRLCTPSFQRKGFSSASYLLLFLLFSLPVSPASLLQSTTLAFSEPCGTIHLPFIYEGYPAGTPVTPLSQRARQVSSSLRLHRFSFKTLRGPCKRLEAGLKDSGVAWGLNEHGLGHQLDLKVTGRPCFTGKGNGPRIV